MLQDRGVPWAELTLPGFLDLRIPSSVPADNCFNEQFRQKMRYGNRLVFVSDSGGEWPFVRRSRSGWTQGGAMTFRLVRSVMVLGLIPVLVGCQSSRQIVRGQNPAAFESQANAPMNGPPPGPMYYDGPAGSGCESRQCQPGHNHPNGAQCPQCAPKNFWVPKHHHTYSYKQPQNLSYPAQNQPAGVVVYPYYTCKGPSDFFMK